MFFSFFLHTFLACTNDTNESSENLDSIEVDLRSKVRVHTITKETFQRTFELSATIEGQNSAILVPKVAGRIESVSVHLGEKVTTGQELLKIEGSDYLAGFQEAKAAWELSAIQAKQAAKTEKRFRTLVNSGAVTQSQYEEVQMAAELAAGQEKRAKAGLDIASNRLNETIVKAPFDGVIIAQNVEIGEMIGGPSQQPPMILVNLDKMKFTASISENDVSAIQPNQSAELVLANQRIPVVIEQINQAVDPVIKTVIIQGTIDNSKYMLKHAQSATVEIKMEQEQLSVPRQALLNRNNQSAEVFILLANNTIQKRNVTYDRSETSTVPVLSGLQNGDTVLISGHNRLHDGDSVVVVAGEN